MANSSITPAPQAINADNHGGYIVITAALLLTWTILFWLIRLAIRVGYNHYFASDDVAATVGTLLGCTQSILIILAVNTAGLGKHAEKLSEDSFHSTELFVYSGDLLFPLALASAKVATSELIARLTRQRKYLLACRLLSTASILWGLASMFAIAIGCHPSHPWDMTDRCSSLHTSWVVISIVDIVTEVCLFLLPALLIRPLQMSWSSKAIVLSAFGSRLPLIAVIALRLNAISGIQQSTDYTWDLVLPIVLAQVELHYGLMAMTIPCLRPFLKAFDTGSLATFAAQIEVGMGASPNAKEIALQSSMKSWRKPSRRSSSILFKSPRVSVISAITGNETAIRPSGPLEIEEGQRELRPVASPVNRTRQSDDRTFSDDGSGRYIISKAAFVHDMRHSRED